MSALPVLKAREAQVLRLMAGGKTQAAIAREMGISERRVVGWAAKARRRLGVGTTIEAIIAVVSSESLTDMTRRWHSAGYHLSLSPCRCSREIGGAGLISDNAVPFS